MPELPEVETTVRGLERFLDGETITRVQLNRKDMRRPFPEGLAQTLVGAKVTGLSRRAKYGLIHTSRGHSVIFHLGMSGKWRINPLEDDKHDHVVLETAAHRFALNDPRRFGWVDVAETEGLERLPFLAKLGPEPLDDSFSPESLAEKLAGKKQPIKLALLDQGNVAGLGNIYVCEALWRAGISPLKEAGSIPKAKLAPLVSTVKAVIGEAIAKGGSTLRDFAAPNGNLGYFAAEFSVYDREGEPCPKADGGLILRIPQGGRSTWYCPKCQK